MSFEKVVIIKDYDWNLGDYPRLEFDHSGGGWNANILFGKHPLESFDIMSDNKLDFLDQLKGWRELFDVAIKHAEEL